MPRIARVTMPSVAHHITQRGNRRQKTFFTTGDYLAPSEEKIKMLQQHERTGRPLGNESFLTRLEKSLGRLLKPKKPGRKPKKTNK